MSHQRIRERPRIHWLRKSGSGRPDTLPQPSARRIDVTCCRNILDEAPTILYRRPNSAAQIPSLKKAQWVACSGSRPWLRSDVRRAAGRQSWIAEKLLSGRMPVWLGELRRVLPERVLVTRGCSAHNDLSASGIIERQIVFEALLCRPEPLARQLGQFRPAEIGGEYFGSEPVRTVSRRRIHRW
jgi:hypothetical protein